MPIDRRLLEILCCPVSKRGLKPLRAEQLHWLNKAIADGAVIDVGGRSVLHNLVGGLISDDAKVIYRIEDDIPVLLPEEGIGITQFQDFPV